MAELTADGALQLARRVLNDSELTTLVLADPVAAAAELEVEQDIATKLGYIVNASNTRAADFAGDPPETGSARRPTPPVGGSDETRALMLEPYGHIRQTFYVLVAMSVTMFLVGVGLMVAAAIRAATGSDINAETIALAGVGLADVTVLFYRRPWLDVLRSLSNTQQTRMVATTYLAGLSLINDGDEQAITALSKMTAELVDMIERYTESAPIDEP